MSIATSVRTNRYAGPCARCGDHVAAEQGLLERGGNGNWIVLHRGDCPAVATPAVSTHPQVGPGQYVVDDVVYRVRRSQRGSLYCLRFDPATTDFEYQARRPFVFLRPEHAMTEDQARAWGLLYGRCVNCDAELTAEQSVHVGYGPTCAKNNGWWYPTAKQLREIMTPTLVAPHCPRHGFDVDERGGCWECNSEEHERMRDLEMSA